MLILSGGRAKIRKHARGGKGRYFEFLLRTVSAAYGRINVQRHTVAALSVAQTPGNGDSWTFQGRCQNADKRRLTNATWMSICSIPTSSVLPRRVLAWAVWGPTVSSKYKGNVQTQSCRPFAIRWLPPLCLVWLCHSETPAWVFAISDRVTLKFKSHRVFSYPTISCSPCPPNATGIPFVL